MSLQMNVILHLKKHLRNTIVPKQDFIAKTSKHDFSYKQMFRASVQSGFATQNRAKGFFLWHMLCLWLWGGNGAFWLGLEGHQAQ